MYFEEQIETMPRTSLEQLQLSRLNGILQHALNSAYYKQLFQDNPHYPQELSSIDEITKLPFTTKDDLRHNYTDL